jgi:hypothetical protein
MIYEENPEDRKQNRRAVFNNKKQQPVKEKFMEQRDKTKIKKELKSKIEKMKEEELWEEWDNEIH